MKEASKPFAWLVLEYLFGSDVKVPYQERDGLPTFTAVKQEEPVGEDRIPQKEESWALEIRG